MQGSGYSAALIAELLAELKAAGHYDSILAEAAAAGPLD
jgi:protein-L-isoaspartate O-methyltransferase